MIDLGTVRPGSTIRIPFSSFDKDDGSSITMTNFAVGDILVYKDGSTTERASTAGYTATTDFDAKTGKHLAVIDLADNTTSGFWNAGSEYLVAIDAVTVDTVTTGGWIARFRIGYAGAMFDTTIATLASQTSFTLTSGPAEDDALNGCTVIIHDVASAVQCGLAVIDDYTGSTKTVTLAAGTTFTAAAGDNISVMFPHPLQPTTAGRKLDVSSGGEAGLDWANVGGQGTSVNLSGTTINLANTLTTYTGNTPQTGDAYAIVNNGTHGNAALNTDLDTLLARLTATRAGYLDNLSGGAVATSAQVNGLSVNTRANLNIPVEIETPDSSTQTYKIRLHLYDVEGNMEAPDSTPTVTLVNAAGTDRSGRLSAASNPSTGVYTWDYTATAGDAEEQLIWIFTVVEGGLTRTYPATSYVVEESAYRFSSSDRAMLTTINNAVDSEVGAIKAKTDQLTFTNANVLDAALANGVVHGGSTATLTLGAAVGPAFNVTATSGDAVQFTGGGTGSGLTATGAGSRAGVRFIGGSSGGSGAQFQRGSAGGDDIALTNSDAPTLRDAILTAGAITATVAPNLDAAVSTRATPAQVNAEVLDVMDVDTFAEPGQGDPPATTTIFGRIRYLYKAWRNKKDQTSSTQKLYADDGTTVDQKAAVSSDGTTTTVGKMGTGP